MSRRSFTPHVLRSTRKIYKLSREKFAAQVGCASVTIKHIESGKLKPSATLAHQIFTQTGLDPAQLIGNWWPDIPMDPIGKILTPDYRERMREKRTSSESKEDVDRSLRHFTVVLESLLDASLAEHKFWAMRPAIQAALDRVIDNFGLGNALKRLLIARWGVEEPWAIRHPDLSLYVKINTADPETVEKVAIMRKEFFRDRDSTQEILKAVRQKTPRLATRKRSAA